MDCINSNQPPTGHRQTKMPEDVRLSRPHTASRPHPFDFPSSNPNDAVGQFTFMPATQTTVVTTTTTTTMSLPPFVMKAPRHLKARDPETYPLAASPTPSSIKRLKLELGDYSTYFEEAEDAEDHLNKYSQQQRSLHHSGGLLKNATESQSIATPPAQSSASTSRTNSDLMGESLRKRSATPLSMSDAAELESFHRRSTRPRHVARKTSARIRHPLRSGVSLGVETASGESEADDESSAEASTSSLHKTSLTNRKAPAAANSQTSSLSLGGLQSPAEIEGLATAPDTASTASSFAESDHDPFASIKSTSQQPRRRIPPGIDTTSIADASLPSPGASPVTAAAQLHRTRTYPLDDSDSDFLEKVTGNSETATGTATSSTEFFSLDSLASQQSASHATFADVPNLIEKFDHLPDNLKTYVMFQLLRRCAKPTIHFVAQAIDPAMRCDFLARLPLELSLQILDNLDAKSLCRAAQVSKKWRSIVDSDERAWMKLIAADGFQMPDGEVERAVREGWGWHYLHSLSDWADDRYLPTALDRDYSRDNITPLTSRSNSGSIPDDTIVLTVSPKRKRRVTPRPTASKRQRRRGVIQEPLRAEPWMKSFESAQGPMAYAQAAATAVPDPQFGLSSLRNLHLFKSIYQRHYLIRKSWMDPEAKPLHHAFRAHQRHVVTCLQFDSDKILTGSDDANIDIYDTKTGATLARLTGHDGGVWALEYQGDLLVSGSTDRTVRIWDMKSARNLHIFQGHTSTVRCLQILKPTKVGETADGKPIMMPKTPLIITGSRDSTCRIWKLPKIGDPSTFQLNTPGNDADNPFFVRVLSGHTNSVRAIAAYADTLVSGSYDSTVRVWKISTGELVHRLQGHTTKVYSVVLDYNRGRCISGSMDNSVKIWSLETGNCLYNLEGHSSLVGLLDLRDDVLVSAAADATLRIWDPQDGRCRHTLTAHTGAITCFSHDGQKIISGSDRTLKMWNAQTGECVRDLLSDLSGVWQIKFDQRRCIAAVQRNNWTYIEVLDFAAARDGIPESERGRRIVVDDRGREVPPEEDELEQVIEVAS